jgi:hypothetical protein
MKKIGENVFVETTFLGCNPGLVITEEGIVMVDAPQKPLEAFSWRNIMTTAWAIFTLMPV